MQGVDEAFRWIERGEKSKRSFEELCTLAYVNAIAITPDINEAL